MSEQFWTEDIWGLFTELNYYHIFPLHYMTIEEKLNAITRFTIYFGVILALLRIDYRYLFIGITGAAISVVLYMHQKRETFQKQEVLASKNLDIVDGKVCARPTVDNPFMNALVSDYANPVEKAPACSIEDPKVKATIERKFDERLFRDVSDIFGKMSSQREFYTMPSTTIPNDQTGFAEWLYGRGMSCKEGDGGQCYRNMYDNIYRR